MPAITKQIPAQQTALPGSLLSRVRKVTDVQAGIRLSLYGNPKVGKTRLACTFPKPLLLIGAEDGTASIVGMEGVDFLLLDNCGELREITKDMLGQGTKYKTAVIDSGTSLRDMRIKEILHLSEMPVQKGFGFASREAWGECAMSLKQLLRPVFDVAKRGTLENLVIIAQEQAYGGDDGVVSDLIKPTVSSALGKSLSDWVNAECDCIGQMFVRMQVVTKTHQPIKDGPTVTMSEKTGEREYCLRVGTDGVYYAGIRVRQGLTLQQSVLTDPSYDRLLRVIKGEKVD